jgi:hypothetical protein
MTTERKVIRAKVGLLELAKQLGNVSHACKMMGYSRDSFYRFSHYRQSHRVASRARPPRNPPMLPLPATEPPRVPTAIWRRQ